MFLSLYLSSSLLLSFCWSGHVFSSLWSNVSKAKNLILLNFWSPLLSKTYLISEQFILLWRALSNPSVPCQALTKIWQKTKYKGFAKVKVIPLKPHLIKNSSSRPLSGGCHQTWQKNPTKNWLKLPPPAHHTSHLFTLTFFRADNWYMFVFTASA